MTNRTNARTSSTWILLAAIAAVPVAGLTPPASAQYQNEQRGDALDANRRIGDDRRNTVGRSYRVDTRIEAVRQPTGNQIVTGNVTGNRQFRGDPGYRDAREFRGSVATDASDDFIRSSAGTSGAANRMTDYNVAVPFYGAGRTVTPPPGFAPQNLAGGGFVPSAAVDNRIDRGAVTPRGGALILNGPVEPIGPLGSERSRGSIITASPLLGVQQQSGDAIGVYGQPAYGQRPGVLDEGTIMRLREELQTGTSPESGVGTSPAGAMPADGTPNRQPVGLDLNAGEGNAQQRQQQRGGPISAQPLGQGTVGSAVTGQATRRRELPTPGEQTPAYAELRRKLEEYARDPNMTDEEAHRAAQRARREAEAMAKQQQQPEQPTVPGGTAPAPDKDAKADPNAAPQTEAERLGIIDYTKRNEELLKDGGKDRQPSQAPEQSTQTPGSRKLPSPPRPAPPAGTGTPAPPTAPAKTGAAKPAPVKVDTLAKGVPGKGLADLLASAESLMKEGRFSSALEKYAAAEQVAPDNPLIKLGRANAELGASYFVPAEQHLRQAFTADEALLMGQYDLRTFYGEDRLKVIANDLKDIASTEKDQPRPVFLLAYVAYNSGNEDMAARYLELADQRSGGKDPLIKKLREHWTLPAAGEAEPAPAEQPPAEQPPAEQPAPAEQPVEPTK